MSNKAFETKGMHGDEVILLAHEKNGGGINESIPMTHWPFPTLSKKQKIKDSLIAKEIIYLCDVKNQKDRAVQVFFENKHRLSAPCYWELLRTLWISNGKTENLETFCHLFTSKRPFRKFLMTVEEDTFFRGLLDPIIAYRAVAGADDRGISWTLDREWCEKYARRYDRQIVQEQFPKSKIFAYFNRRNEHELIVL